MAREQRLQCQGQGAQVLTTFTADANPPWGADAGASHRVTGHPLSTPAQVGTASAEAALWTGCQEETGG